MKKILLVLLVVVLMIGCGVGGYFVRDHVVEAQTYSLESAVNVVKKVSQNSKFIKLNEEGGARGLSSNYDDYEGTKVDYNGKEAFAKTFLSLFYYAVDGEVRASTYYTSTATYNIGNIDVTGTINFYIDLTEDTAYFYLKDVENDMSTVMVVREEDNKAGHYQVEILMEGTFSATSGVTYIIIASDEEKIIQFGYSEVETNVNNLHDIKVEDIRELTVFDCDLLGNRIMNKSTTNNNITDQQKLDVVSRSAEVFADMQFIDVIYKDFIEKDFMYRAYKNLGYNVVENN